MGNFQSLAIKATPKPVALRRDRRSWNPRLAAYTVNEFSSNHRAFFHLSQIRLSGIASLQLQGLPDAAKSEIGIYMGHSRSPRTRRRRARTQPKMRRFSLSEPLHPVKILADWQFVLALDAVWNKIRHTVVTPKTPSERHRAQRFPFVAGIQVTDVATEKHLAAHTRDLSMFGCLVETVAPFPTGTKVRVGISYGGANFTAQGKVAYSRNNRGMGIAFTLIDPSSLSILDAWLSKLRK